MDAIAMKQTNFITTSFLDQVLESNNISQKRRNNLIAFGWYGGKYSHLSWLLPLLPRTNHYCEPFGGSGAVLVNREPSPVETYNDLDGEVVNFFKVLREQRDELIEAIGLTPFSRKELVKAIKNHNKKLSNMERARRFYIKARQTRTGLAQSASEGRWATCRDTSRRGMSGAVSRWLASPFDLVGISARLLRVQIENRPAIQVIRSYDSEDTLFYCDPPYPHESRGDTSAYKYEMRNAEHEELSSVLHSVKGKVAVSGYDCPLMEELYKAWHRIDAPERVCHSVKQKRRESLWINYDI